MVLTRLHTYDAALPKNFSFDSSSRRIDTSPASFISSGNLWCFIIGHYVPVPMHIFLWKINITLQQPPMNSVWSGRKLMIMN